MNFNKNIVITGHNACGKTTLTVSLPKKRKRADQRVCHE